MRYADLAAPKLYARNPRSREAALVVRPENVTDLLALLEKRSDYVLVERAQPGPDLPVMHYIRCSSTLDAERLERAWRNHIFEKWRQHAPSSIASRENQCAQSARWASRQPKKFVVGVGASTPCNGGCVKAPCKRVVSGEKTQ